MLHSSIPVGKFLGVDIRVHISFPFLLILAIAWAMLLNHPALRGVGLWTALCFAVIVREAARSIAAAYSGLRLRALFLLPVGGIMAFAPRDPNPPAGSPASIPSQWDTRAVAAAGPMANFLTGLILLGASYAFDPHVSLLAPPWIGTAHILRTFVWTQFILGAVSLLPASLLASRNLPRPRIKSNQCRLNGARGCEARAAARSSACDSNAAHGSGDQLRHRAGFRPDPRGTGVPGASLSRHLRIFPAPGIPAQLGAAGQLRRSRSRSWCTRSC